ncbi:MAG: PQQ-dependent sugar dehydrogenase [Ignavibacteria bacterium]
MNKIKLVFFILLIFSLTSNGNAQYKMVTAFPNMTAAFDNPIELVHAYDGTNRLFVAQQRGLIYVFNNSPTVSTRKTFINLSSKVSSSGSEKGLLGLTFHPNYETNRYFYVNYTFDSAAVPWSRISRYTASSANPDTALLNTESILLTLRQPFDNHNGGKVAFGNDGYLYISFGDGGSGGDPFDNGQSRITLLGKILRINVDTTTATSGYGIPSSNPYFAHPTYKKEIYAYGLRNVWKFNFDYPTNRIYAGDVGQNVFEEVDIIEIGKNYGWNKMEGFHCYPDTNICDTAGRGFTRPILEYRHNVGQSITGGHVYRGQYLPGLTGRYVYADYIQGTVWALRYDGINPVTNVLLQDTNFNISAFGTDQNNELYVCRYGSTTGRIYKFVNTSVLTLDLKAAIQGYYEPSTNKLNIRDTVDIYLRSTIAPYALIDSTSAVLDSLTFSSPAIFSNAPAGSYYIVIKSRNTLETWSKIGGESFVKGGLTSYDFTNDSTKAYGNNLEKEGSVYTIFSGDVNSDGVVDGSDVSIIDNDAASLLLGYNVSDLTGDGIVDGSDLLIADNNATQFVILIRP